MSTGEERDATPPPADQPPSQQREGLGGRWDARRAREANYQQPQPGYPSPGHQQPSPGYQQPGYEWPPQGYPPPGHQQPPPGHPPPGYQQPGYEWPPQGYPPPGHQQPPPGHPPPGYQHPPPGYPPPDYQWPPPGYPPAQPPRVDSTFAWTLAAAPLVYAFLPLAFPGISDTTALVAAVVVNSVLALADANRVNKSGANINGALALFLVPAYLVLRTIRVKSSPAIPVVWGVALMAVLVLGNVIAANGPVTMDGPKVERQLTDAIQAQYGEYTDVTCPDEPKVKLGDSFTCTVMAAGTEYRAEVTVTDSDGRYQWTLTQ